MTEEASRQTKAATKSCEYADHTTVKRGRVAGRAEPAASVTSVGPYRIEITSGARRGLHRLPPNCAAIVEFGPLAREPARYTSAR
jgi:hypothetical protein